MSTGKERPLFPMFHGSDAELTPGTVVSARTKAVAHATHSVSTARVFAGKSGHVYEVEPVDANRVWEREMKHTGREVHHEVLSPVGFRVKGKLPPSRRDSHYDARRQEVVAYNRANNIRHCEQCAWPHGPGRHYEGDMLKSQYVYR